MRAYEATASGSNTLICSPISLTERITIPPDARKRTKDLPAHRRWDDFVPLIHDHHRAAREAAREHVRGGTCVSPVAHEWAEVAVRQPGLRVKSVDRPW